MFFLFRGLPVLIEIGLLVYCLIDCVQSPPHAVRAMPRWAWALVIVVLPFFGSIAWLLFGRPPGGAADVPWAATGTAGSPGYERPRPPRTVAPDDDPEFLDSLRKKRDDGPAEGGAGSAEPQR
jgi:hypothetical protein